MVDYHYGDLSATDSSTDLLLLLPLSLASVQFHLYLVQYYFVIMSTIHSSPKSAKKADQTETNLGAEVIP